MAVEDPDGTRVIADHARVLPEGAGRVLRTNSEGEFSIKGLTAGSWTLRFSDDANGDGLDWIDAITSYGDGDLGTPDLENDSCIMYIGNDTEFSSSSSHAANYLLGSKITVPTATTLDTFGVIFKSGSADYKMALYTDSSGNPGTLVAQTGTLTYSGSGRVEPDIADVALPAGDYWIMAIFNTTASLGISYASGTTVKYRGLSFSSPLPTTFGSPTTYSGQEVNDYIVVY